MQHNRSGGGEWPACYGRSGIDLPRPILIFVASKKNGPPAAAVAATMSAADSNFCCCDGRLRPILISVAAKENGSACNGRGGYEARFRFHSSLPRRKMVPPVERHYPTDASILDFEARLGNHCRFLPGNALQYAVIIDFRPKLANHCKVFPV